jgi:hypothetical protein
MAAEIRSEVIAPVVKAAVDNASRDDLGITDVVQLTAIGGGTTFQWTLVYVPEGSTAVLTPAPAATTAGPVTFTVNKVGPYLVRLVVDAGLVTESTQYVRLRALTVLLGLHLVAAGERRDSSGIIPVDVDIEGWANEQNSNLLALEAALVTRDYHIKMLGGLDAGVLPVRGICGLTQADDTLYYRGWCPSGSTLLGMTVYMNTLNTVGNYTLEATNVSAAASCLNAPFDMNTLVAATVTDMTLTGVAANLDFAAKEVWEISLASDNVGFDGTEVYIGLRFGVS